MQAAAQQQDHELQLQEDIAQFVNDPLGFVLYAFPWGQPGPLADFDGPDIWQAEQLMAVGQAFDKDPEATIQEAIASGHGIGKAQPYSLQVDTPAGRRMWGELNPGDYVFGVDGKPTKVKARHEQGVRPIYRVTFSDGSSTLVDKDHLWAVRGRKHRRRQLVWATMTTAEIMDAGVKRPNGVAEARQWEIPHHSAVEFPPALQHTDPYVMGVWLGDGSKCSGAVTSADAEVLDACANFYQLGPNRNTGGGLAETRTLRGLTKDLRADGAFGFSTSDCRVPERYRYASARQRLAVLQGLLDTDGWVEVAGTVAFGSISSNLAADVAWLARSLGLVARLKGAKEKWYTGSDGERIMGRPFHVVTITWDGATRLFRLDRKQSKLTDPQDRYKARWIDSIEYSHDEHAMCITVDAVDSLYLTNDFIVTHNSAEVAWILLWACSTRPHIAGWVTANTQAQLKSKTWRELAVWHKRAVNAHWFQWTATRFHHVDHPETWGIDALPWTEHNSESFAGLHAKYVLMIMDEASAIADKIWEVAEGAMTTPRAMWFCFGNPTKTTGRFRECFGKYKHRWRGRQIDSRTCKMTNKVKINEWLEDHGEDSDFFRVRVRGQFPRLSTQQLVSSEHVEEARKRDLQIDAYIYQPLVMGVDVARFGSDESVITIRQGRKVWPQKLYHGLNNIQLAARVAEVYRGLDGPATILVDEVGVGAGVVDYLMSMGYPVIGVNAGAKAEDDKKYYNKRSEMWCRMRDWFEGSGDIPDDPILSDQITALEYQYDLKERIKLERKEDLRDRLPELGSPDRADSLALTFAEIVAPVREDDSFEPEGFEE